MPQCCSKDHVVGRFANTPTKPVLCRRAGQERRRENKLKSDENIVSLTTRADTSSRRGTPLRRNPTTRSLQVLRIFTSQNADGAKGSNVHIKAEFLTQGPQDTFLRGIRRQVKTRHASMSTASNAQGPHHEGRQ
jgi:hypothetical protein